MFIVVYIIIRKKVLKKEQEMSSKFLSFFKLHFPNQCPKDGTKRHSR